MRRFAQNKTKEKTKLDPKSLPELNVTPELLKDLDPKKHEIIERVLSDFVELAFQLVVLGLAFKGLNLASFKNFKPKYALLATLDYYVIQGMHEDLTEATDLLKRIDKNTLNAVGKALDNNIRHIFQSIETGASPWDAIWEESVKLGANPNYEAIPDIIEKALGLINGTIFLLMSAGVVVPPTVWIGLQALAYIFRTENAKDLAAALGGFASYQQMLNFEKSADLPTNMIRVLQLFPNEKRTEYNAVELIDTAGLRSGKLFIGQKWRDVQLIKISPSVIKSNDYEFRDIIVSNKGKLYKLKFGMFNQPTLNNPLDLNWGIQQFIVGENEKGENNYTELIRQLIDDYIFENKLRPRKDTIDIRKFTEFVKNHRIKSDYSWIGDTKSYQYVTLQTYIVPAISLYNQSVKTQTPSGITGNKLITPRDIDNYQIPRGSIREKKLNEVIAAIKQNKLFPYVNWNNWTEVGKLAIISYAIKKIEDENIQKAKEEQEKHLRKLQEKYPPGQGDLRWQQQLQRNMMQ